MKSHDRLDKIFPNPVPETLVWIIITMVIGTGAVLISKISNVLAILVLIASLCTVTYILYSNASTAAILSHPNLSQKRIKFSNPINWSMDALVLGFYWAISGFLVAVIVPPAKFYPIITLLLSFSVTSFIYGTVHRYRIEMIRRRNKADKN